MIPHQFFHSLGYNPGSSAWCTVVGIAFYGTILGTGGYTACFSMALWRQFFAPLNSIWHELEHKSYCKCCCGLLTRCRLSSPQCCTACDECKSAMDDCLLCLPKQTKQSICCVSPHFAIFTMIIVYVLCGCMERGIDAIPPIGLCLIGTRDDGKTLRYHVIPETTFLFLSALFLIPAVALLVRLASVNVNREKKKEFRHLQWRMLVFFLCILATWSLTVAMVSFIFYLDRPQFEEAAAERVSCMLLRGGKDVEECVNGYTYWVGWYVLVAVAMPIAGIGSLVLSCNVKNVQRWELLREAVLEKLCRRTVLPEQPSLLIRMATVKGDESSSEQECSARKEKLEVPTMHHKSVHSRSVPSATAGSVHHIVDAEESVIEIKTDTVELTTK